MYDIHTCTSSIRQLKLLNACRLYLQVTFISEITNILSHTSICGVIIGKNKPNNKQIQVIQQKNQQRDM